MFVEKLPPSLQSLEMEKYAVMHTSEFTNVFGSPMKATTSSSGIEGYLSITNKAAGKTIYRKYCGWKTIDTSTVGLGYRSLCELGITEEELKNTPPVVDVKKECWFTYYWKNSDSGIRAPFRIGVWSLIVGAIAFCLQVLFYIF